VERRWLETSKALGRSTPHSQQVNRDGSLGGLGRSRPRLAGRLPHGVYPRGVEPNNSQNDNSRFRQIIWAKGWFDTGFAAQSKHGIGLSLSGDHGKAMAILSHVLQNVRNPGLEGVAIILCHLAHAQLRAGLLDASRATAEQAGDLARRHGHKISLAYAEWLLEGPNSRILRILIKETGAEHYMRLRHPRYQSLV
jgi:hypothetical protein